MRTGREIRLFWAGGSKKIVNYGDALSAPILERLTGRKVVFAKPATADLAAAGSIFKSFMDTRWRRPWFGRFNPIRVWGSGSLSDAPLETTFFEAPLVDIRAVRGPLTRDAIGAPADLPLGDPGLFADMLMPGGARPKSHAVGLIPHKDDRFDPEIQAFLDQTPQSRMIDLTNPDLVAVTEMIAGCELIVSSSLHGVVAADALGIPSVYAARVGQGGAGDVEFKFADYFGGVGREARAPMTLRDAMAGADLSQAATMADESVISARKDGLSRSLDQIL